MKHTDVTTKSKGTFPKASHTVSASSESAAKGGDGAKNNQAFLNKAKDNVSAQGGTPMGKSGPGGYCDKSAFSKADNKSWPTGGSSVDVGK